MKNTLLATCLLAACSCERRVPDSNLEQAPVPDAGTAAEPLAAPDAGSPPEPIRVPRGCEVNLGGTWRVAREPAVRYAIEDDGKTAVIRPLAEPSPNASFEGYRGPVMRLERTPRGFVGAVHSTGRTGSGRMCPVSFAAEVVSCGGGKLEIETERARPVSESCQLGAGGGETSRELLVRE